MPATVEKTPSRLLTEREAAERLGLAYGTLCVWRTTKRYALPFVKCGRAVRYRGEDIDAFIAARTVHQVEAAV